MYNKIIIASALDQGFNKKALKAAKALLSESGKITVIHVMEPVNGLVQSLMHEDVDARAYDAAKAMMAERLMGEEGIDTEILRGRAANEISGYAKKVGADCIILGSHKPGFEDYLLGTTSARVVRHATCCVHVLR